MTKLERIKKMLDNENNIIKRTAKEVTVDFDAVRAELRAECLDEVIQLFDPKPLGAS